MPTAIESQKAAKITTLVNFNKRMFGLIDLTEVVIYTIKLDSFNTAKERIGE